MKTFEMIQRATLGGSPAPNEAGFEHGTPVYVIHGRELMSFLYKVRQVILDGQYDSDPEYRKALINEMEELLLQENYVCRTPDLPETSLYHERNPKKPKGKKLKK